MIDRIIFRIPGEDGEATLAELKFEDGVLNFDGMAFTVDPSDSYADLPFDRIVLAEFVDGGSISRAVYQIAKSHTLDEEWVHHLDRDSLQTIISHLVAEHEESVSADINFPKRVLH